MFKTIFSFYLIFLMISDIAVSQEIIWQKEYDVMVNGELMINAYSGGDNTGWPRHTFVDIDKDGDEDLFLGKYSGQISFYRNEGDSLCPVWTFVTEFYESIDVGWHASPTFCDIDKDYDYDLFIGNGDQGCNGGNVWFYRNIGTQDSAIWFFETNFLASIDVCDNSVPTFVDIDSDDDFDLFVGGGYGKIAFFQNIGTPQIPIWDSVTSNYNSIDVGYKSTPTFFDIDADGDKDLFIGDDWGKLYYYQNIGTANIPVWTLITDTFAGINFGHEYTAPAFTDIDGDGDGDLFVSESYSNINYFRNDGNQQNPDWTYITTNFINNAIDVSMNSCPSFVDIDNDNDFDLFIGTIKGNIWLYKNNSDNSEPNWCLESEVYDSIDTYLRSVPRFCDIDADGDYDLFLGDNYGTIFYYQNNGTTDSASWNLITEMYDSIDVGYHSVPSFVDIDADADYDLFIGNSSGNLIYYQNIGTPDSALWVLISEMYDSINVYSYSKPFFIDIDYDNDYDLLIGNWGGRIHFYRNDGDSSTADFIFISDYYNSIDIGEYSTPFLIDIDTDGDVDLFVGEKDGGINFWRNVGTISIKEQVEKPLSIINLFQNYPNPFNTQTEILFYLSEKQTILLEIYNIHGQKVKTLLNENLAKGKHSIIWNGKYDNNKEIPGGIYFYKLKSANNEITKKMLKLQ